jgi:hypothetical protein
MEMQKMIDAAYEKPLIESNPRTEGIFIPEFTCSPHPRFLGLANAIKSRRTEKVKILSPIY